MDRRNVATSVGWMAEEANEGTEEGRDSEG